MSTATLTHCQALEIPLDTTPATGKIDLTVAGYAYYGTVNVLVDGGAPIAGVECGSSDDPEFADITVLKLHYYKSPLGPTQIEVEYAVTLTQ